MTKKESKIKIFVSHHKPGYIYEDDIFVPIQVGKEESDVDLGILGDDTGDNISKKNPGYCELTAHYWVWKNYDLTNIDYVGFCHYRRYPTYYYKTSWENISGNIEGLTNKLMFYKENNYITDFSTGCLKNTAQSIKQFISNNKCNVYLTGKDVFINPISKYKDYFLNLGGIALYKIAITTFTQIYPNYKKDLISTQFAFKYNHRNMFIMEKSLFLKYSKRLFDYLFALEEVCRKNNIVGTERLLNERGFGIHSEIFINIWAKHYKRLGKKISYDANILFLK